MPEVSTLEADINRMSEASRIALLVIEQSSKVFDDERNASFAWDISKLMLKLARSNMQVARALYEAGLNGERG